MDNAKKETAIKNINTELKKYPNNAYLKFLNSVQNIDLDSKIAVQIPSYCDPELTNTVQSCLLNAINPDRVTIIICYQNDDLETLKKLQEIPNCRIKHYAKKDAPGTNAARYECNILVQDEKYVLHIDSHMRFTKFWDIALIAEWEACQDEKAILTARPLDYGNKIESPLVSAEWYPGNINGKFINATHYESNSIRLWARAITDFEKTDTKPRLGAFISAGFLFAKADIDKTVPNDPNMYFMGDENAMAVKYYTHGFNIYQPHLRFIYHLYGRTKKMEEIKNIKIERFEKNDICSEKAQNEVSRIEQLFRIANHNIDLKEFDIGTMRSIEDYEKFAGIDFKNKTIKTFAHQGVFDKLHTETDLTDYDWHSYDWRS